MHKSHGALAHGHYKTVLDRKSLGEISNSPSELQVWKNSTMNTYWQNVQFWVNYPFKDLFRANERKTADRKNKDKNRAQKTHNYMGVWSW